MVCKFRIVAFEQCLTVPYLGKGLGDCDMEFQLKTGQFDLNKKTVNNTMEQSFSEYKKVFRKYCYNNK